MEHKEMWSTLVNILVKCVEDEDIKNRDVYMDILEAMKVLEEK